MGFASAWLQNRSLFPALISEAPESDTGIIAVIPSYNETGITGLLDSITRTDAPSCGIEIIIIVNAPPRSDDNILRNNLLTIEKVMDWKLSAGKSFRSYPVNIDTAGIKGWGVGLARKTGMDEALRRFDIIGKPEGIIACLDADCRISRNYFTALEEELLKRKDRKACSVFFEHPLSGEEHPAELYNSIVQYELHLRYYNLALRYTGFPRVFHTVGSTLAVKALSYMKAGGMNRRQAGEDFYFVQKLIPAGGYFSLNSATVYPSPRVSDRVPFGTGHAMGKMKGSADRVFLTYSPGAFNDLKDFFIRSLLTFDRKESGSLPEAYKDLPDSVREFLTCEEYQARMTEIFENTSGRESFKKRFFEWFNMFRVVKYLNHSHLRTYKKMPAVKAANDLMEMTGLTWMMGDETTGLLMNLRKYEREIV